jgi:hypothetical protein
MDKAAEEFYKMNDLIKWIKFIMTI